MAIYKHKENNDLTRAVIAITLFKQSLLVLFDKSIPEMT
jgi:hypothetical protein